MNNNWFMLFSIFYAHCCIRNNDNNIIEFKKIENSTPVIGWIGGDHNYPLLDRLLPILNDISEHVINSMSVICFMSLFLINYY